ncbi:MAG: ChaN family lipoprotein [Sulfitobacter sp.]
MKKRYGLVFFLAMPAGAEVPPFEATADIRQADIVILGEIHDNAEHHLGQAALMAQLKPKAVVFEMLSPAQADTFNRNPRDDLDAAALAMAWASSGWPAFDLYRPVFGALGDTPVVGAAAPRPQVRAASTDGAAATFGPKAALFGLDQPLPKDQLAQRSAMQFDAHCGAMPLEMMGGMVEAQRLRDAWFSKSALDALRTFGAPVVVIAGNGHARRDWGMPAAIARAAKTVTVHSIGFVELPEPQNDQRFDTVFPTPAAQRDDPCAAFTSQ